MIIGEGTPEAIAERMAENNGRIAVVSAEGGLLDILGGMYSESKVNLDPILHGYSGEPINSVRIGRKCKRIDAANLSIALAVQPVVLEELLDNETLSRRGVTGRILYSLPPSMLGKRDSINAREVPVAVSSRYRNRLREILSQEEIRLTLSPGALEAFNNWDRKVEAMLSPGKELSRLTPGWGGKMLGNTARIAGLLCLLEGQGIEVAEYTMHSAVTIAEYFISQLAAITGANAIVSSEASEVLSYLIRLEQPEVSHHLIKQALKNRKRFRKAEFVDTALAELEYAGYIRPKPITPHQGKGRPPQPMYQLNPLLLKKTDSMEIII